MLPSEHCLLIGDLITRMLQRDPKRRASLEEIENHPWLQGVDPSPATKYNIPLVSYKNLSEEEHNSIIQRMVLGDIADRDAIVEQSWPTKIDVPQDLEDDLTATPLSHATVPQSPARAADSVLNGHRSKGLCDSAKKDDLPELAGPALSTGPPASLKPAASGRKCLFRVEEDEEEDEEDKKPMSLSTQVVLRRKPSVTNRLTSRKSAPVLNQIFEEGESDDEFDMDENLPPKLSRLKMSIASPGTVHKRYHRRKRTPGFLDWKTGRTGGLRAMARKSSVQRVAAPTAGILKDMEPQARLPKPGSSGLRGGTRASALNRVQVLRLFSGDLPTQRLLESRLVAGLGSKDLGSLWCGQGLTRPENRGRLCAQETGLLAARSLLGLETPLPRSPAGAISLCTFSYPGSGSCLTCSW
ncbi:SNF-related serine/threonine-protein kinase, partial [Eschrichtius robustus]|nr:SNF-related serine/threonine-protein kinase [Eschrichtius robustus]